MVEYDYIQNFRNTLNRCLATIKRLERLSQEACIEELCKVLVVKLGASLSSFAGWSEKVIKSKTFDEVYTSLEPYCFDYGEKHELGRAFTEFLQENFGGNISDYSTPSILTKYVFNVLDLNGIESVFDPCCGIGGSLAEAYCQKSGKIKLYGNDISRTMVNTTKLALMIYGYDEDTFTCEDFAKKANEVPVAGYDCIVAHIPTRRQVLSEIGANWERPTYDYREIEEIFIEKILTRLNPDGIAAIIVPSGLMEKRAKRNFRQIMLNKSEILNITRFDEVAYSGHSSKNSFQVIFLKNSGRNSHFRQCSATLLKGGLAESEIKDAVSQVSAFVYSNQLPLESASCKVFSFSNVENWNITLLFLRDGIGKKYPTVTLKEILTLRRNKAVTKPDKEYKVLRVRRRGMGVDVKRIEYGRAFAEKMFVVHPNDLVVSSFEADMGGVGFAAKELDGALVTKDFYLYEIDKKRVDLNYLMMVLTSDPVLEQLQAMNKRTYVLSRLSMSDFLSVVIPLPELAEQKAMAKELQKYINKAQKAEEELEEGRKDFNMNLFGRE
ncbi:MAG: N-6 DNA methylase [Bacteroidales bacterium]|nr:N-6 DNA methylase [Bacteroidales bacterium]